jgi:predicted Zn-dependent peptidase
VATAPETAREATAAIREELTLVAERGLPDDELAAGKSQLRGQLTLSLESVTSRMYRAAGVELYDEPYRPLDEVLALVEAIDQDTVSAVCREFFAPEQQTVLSLGPAPAQ